MFSKTINNSALNIIVKYIFFKAKSAINKKSVINNRLDKSLKENLPRLLFDISQNLNILDFEVHVIVGSIYNEILLLVKHKDISLGFLHLDLKSNSGIEMITPLATPTIKLGQNIEYERAIETLSENLYSISSENAYLYIESKKACIINPDINGPIVKFNRKIKDLTNIDFYFCIGKDIKWNLKPRITNKYKPKMSIEDNVDMINLLKEEKRPFSKFRGNLKVNVGFDGLSDKEYRYIEMKYKLARELNIHEMRGDIFNEYYSDDISSLIISLMTNDVSQVGQQIGISANFISSTLRALLYVNTIQDNILKPSTIKKAFLIENLEKLMNDNRIEEQNKVGLRHYLHDLPDYPQKLIDGYKHEDSTIQQHHYQIYPWIEVMEFLVAEYEK
jgi:hypothetical protein